MKDVIGFLAFMLIMSAAIMIALGVVLFQQHEKIHELQTQAQERGYAEFVVVDNYSMPKFQWKGQNEKLQD